MQNNSATAARLQAPVIQFQQFEMQTAGRRTSCDFDANAKMALIFLANSQKSRWFERTDRHFSPLFALIFFLSFRLHSFMVIIIHLYTRHDLCAEALKKRKHLVNGAISYRVFIASITVSLYQIQCYATVNNWRMCLFLNIICNTKMFSFNSCTEVNIQKHRNIGPLKGMKRRSEQKSNGISLVTHKCIPLFNDGTVSLRIRMN